MKEGVSFSEESFDRAAPAGPRTTWTAPSLRGAPSNTATSTDFTRTLSSAGASPFPKKKQRDERLETLLSIREQTMQQSVNRGLEKSRKKREEEACLRDEKFDALVAELEAGKRDLLPRTDETVHHHEQWRRKKAMDTYEAWKSNVYEPIQRAIKESSAARPIWEIEDRLRTQYDEYLRVTNEKAGVYRDIIIKEDYDPLKRRSSTIRVMPKIRDPMKVELTKTAREQLLMGKTGGQTRGGRYTLDLTWWDKVEATPHGHQVNPNTNKNGPSVSKSGVVFDHFRYPRGAEGMQVVEQLYRTGAARKSVATGGRNDPNARENMFEVIRHEAVHETVDHMKATGRAQNDLWLSAKGKTRILGPEFKTGRPNLFPVLHQVPPSDVDRAADYWLSHKGKAKPPGPEERIGRKNLFQVVQPLDRKGGQGFPGEADFNPRGDLYLEQIYMLGKRALAAPQGKDVMIEGTVRDCLSDLSLLQNQGPV